MKYKVLIIASMILFGNAYSQDYKPVLTNGVVHFFDSSSQKMLPYRIDSILVTDSSVIYRSFPMIRPFADLEPWSALFHLKGGSWIGNKTEAFPDGRWLFYNFRNKTSVIYSLAQPGFSWNFFQFENGAIIKAEIENIQILSFLGILDSVKIIHFSYFDSIGNPADHFVNDLNLKLSKNYGFISMFDFYKFPENPIDYIYNTGIGPFTLVGFSQPKTGYQNIRFSDIFNFSPGDEIHDLYYFNAYVYGFDEQKTMRKVLNAQMEGNDVHLTIERCYRREWRGYNDTANQLEHIFDTLVQTYENATYSFLDNLAFEIFNNGFSFSYPTCTSEKKSLSGQLFLPYNGDTVQNILTDGYGFSDFYPGLGGPFGNSTGCDSESFFNIVYYKKNGMEHGNPYHCPSLLPIDETSKNKINVYPNPVNETFRIKGLAKAARVEIFNMQGQKMQDFEILPGREINATGLNTGMYLIKIQLKNKTICKRIWKN